MSLLQHFAQQLLVHGLSPRHRVAVAVSGGSDSLALALLTAWWRGHGEIPSPSNAADVTDALRVAPSLDINPLPPELVQSARSLLRGAADAATPLADPQRPQLALQQLGSLSAAGSSPAAAAHPLCGVAYALVVDHGLRPESRAEAAQTAETVARWGLQPVLLTAEWPEGRPSHGQLMSAARAERQRLFRQACQQHGIMDLLVAHQADDQVETFLLRLSRASGVDGLVGMAAAASLIAADPTAARGSGSVPSGVPPETSAAAAPGTDAGGSPKILAFTVRVLRPLLGVQRSQLRALLARCRVAWVEDPTNADTSYSRNAIRALLTQPQRQQQLQRHQQQPAANLVSNQPSGMQLDTSAASQPADAHDSGSRQAAADMAALPAAAEGAATVTYDLLRLQRRCAAAVAEMQGAAAALLAECAPEHLQQARVPGTIVITLPPLAMALLPVVVRMLSAVLWAVSGKPMAPQQSKVQRLARMVSRGRMHLRQYNCGGCTLYAVAGSKGQLVSIAPHQQQQGASKDLGKG